VEKARVYGKLYIIFQKTPDLKLSYNDAESLMIVTYRDRHFIYDNRYALSGWVVA
jgi:hypothetical protein